MSTAEILAEAVDRSRNWTLTLIADVKGDEWTFQPKPGLHHVLWLCGHLACSEHLLILTRCLSGPNPPAEFAGHFAIGGAIKSATEHDYPSPQAVREMMDTTHANVLSAIRGMSDAAFAEPCYGKDGVIHPYYNTKAGAILHASRHEGFHAGQIALVRRLMGKSFLR